MIKMNKDKYALLGKPVELSPSPQIHQSFAASLGEQIVYHKIEVEKEQFGEVISSFFREGGKGLNITVPYKQDAYLLAEVKTVAAEQAKAVNTLWIEKGKLHGDNTDGIGFIKDCIAKEIQIQQKKVLVLGAGGAVRGILAPLLEQNPSKIIIANRTIENAEQLVSDFASLGEITASELSKIPNQKVDVIINGLALHDFPSELQIFAKEDASYYDLKYGQAAESGVNWAVEHSINHIFDGWGMLVRQAAQSYFIWRHQLPSINELIENPSVISEEQSK